MKQVTFRLIGETPLMFGKHHGLAKKPNETDDHLEERVWRERSHHDQDGALFIPAAALATALADVGKVVGRKIVGKGNKTFAGAFRSGIIVAHNLPLFTKRDRRAMVADLIAERQFVSADGTRGGGKRVYRIFPTLFPWEADAVMQVIDPDISKEILIEHLSVLSERVCMLMYRPARGGMNGRFNVVHFRWAELPGSSRVLEAVQ